MTAPGRYAASDNSFARSAGGAAARGGILIAVAVVLGLVLLKWGFDGGDESAAVPPDVEVDVGADGNGGTATPGDTVAPGDTVPTDTVLDDVGTVPDDSVTTPTTPGVAVDPPGEVKVAVLNGRGEPGLGKARSDVLVAAGYVSVGVNAVSFDNELSRIYYTPGYEDEAKAVATALNAGSSVLDEAPADPLALVAEDQRENVGDFDIFVMLGADGVLG